MSLSELLAPQEVMLSAMSRGRTKRIDFVAVVASSGGIIVSVRMSSPPSRLDLPEAASPTTGPTA